MNDPLAIQHRMEHVYRLFVESSFPLQNSTLSEERRSLLAKAGVLSQPPLIEPVPIYQSSGLTLDAATEKLPAGYELLAKLAEPLFPDGRNLYSHQWEALEASLSGRDIVITTGTGSGKTEAFLLPVLAGLAAELKSWERAGQSDETRFWWRHQPQWTPQWGHTTRKATLRTIVLYPLNALVEDQLRRLRSVLDRPETITWLDDVANGNRITFARYTGETPVAGAVESKRTQRLRSNLREQDRLQGERERLKELGNQDEYNFPDLSGGEMWSRWDCQTTPPDILITNYSMLNIMLMRDIEQPMFEATRNWLAESPDNRLRLVVDELHSYRGTAGTEVSYILRLLLHRLGLDPDSDQLNILATSASIPENDAGRNFLSEFFGRSPDRFDFIGTPMAVGDEIDICHLHDAFRNVSVATPGHPLQGGDSSVPPDAIEAFMTESSSSQMSSLSQCLLDLRVPEALLEACKGFDNDIRATPVQEIAEKLFGSPEHIEPLRGLLLLLSAAKRDGSQALQPVRSHLFFQNIHNLWACTNPSCHDSASDAPPNIGRLFTEHHLTCPECSSRVLELIVCEVCGEVFLGGRRYRQSQNAEILSSDSLDLDTIPDQPHGDKHSAYAVILPVHRHDNAAINHSTYSWNKTKRSWRRSFLLRATGELTQDKSASTLQGSIPVWTYTADSSSEDSPAFPSRCPCCAADYGRRNVLPTPLRRHGTGVQRSVQILAGALLREVDATSRKLVVFSDSRQDAARLSAGLEQDHYRDSVRVAALSAIRESAANLEGAVRRVLQNAPDREAMLTALQEINPRIAEAAAEPDQSSDPASFQEFQKYNRDASKSLRLLGFGDAADKELIRVLTAYPDRATFTDIGKRVFQKLAALGICPAGTSKEALFFKDAENGNPRNWDEAFDWDSEVVRAKSGLGPSNYSRRAHELLRTELTQVLFTHQTRTLESTGLGYVTVPVRGATKSEQEATNAIVRSLCVRKRFVGSRFVEPGSETRLGGPIKPYLENAGIDVDKITQMLLSQGILEPESNGAILRLDDLQLVTCPADAQKYKCEGCNAVYLHPAAGRCVHCRSGKVSPIEDHMVSTAVDYYSYLAGDGGQLFRMNAQELTGQNDGSDRLSRQRRFQNVFLDGENPKAQGVDLLSVTTTMEAGVDIGALNAVMMGNMPPRRFNYQQRVGRAGRRGAGLSLAITLCRGRTHDSYYYANPKAITGDPPPSPYIDTSSASIFRRVLVKEALRRAFRGFREHISDAASGSESVHGAFGTAEEWAEANSKWRARLEEYLANDVAREDLYSLSEVLAEYTRMSHSDLNFARESIDELPDVITEIAKDPRLSHIQISERMANRGLLPMFGFPTRTRRLFLDGLRSQWPPKNVVDRDLEQAISGFAPGASLVKDKLVYTVSGVVALKPGGFNKVVDEPGLFPPLGQPNPHPLGICTSCHTLVESTDLADKVGDRAAICPTCGEETVRVIDAREPRDFFALHEPEDYGGFFEFRGRTTRPLLGVATEGKAAAVANANIIGGSNTVLSFNDNDGRGGFDFVPNSHRKNAYQVPGDNQRRRGEFSEPIALLARRVTDTLQVGVNTWPLEHAAVPQTVEGRAAWYGLAFALRNGAARRLDIESGELDCGLYVASRDGSAEGQAFLCDSLENGAGYATHFSDPDLFSSLLETLESTVVKDWRGHAGTCDSSCAKCMRDYDNMPYHPLLDWRLATDMINIIKSPGYSLSLRNSHWSQLIEDSGERIVRSLSQLEFEPLPERTTLPVFMKGSGGNREALIIRHPLWTETHPQIEETRKELLDAGITWHLGTQSPYILLRMPTTVLSLTPQSLVGA